MPKASLMKVCGMREPANIQAISALGVDALGFIFYAPSKRNALEAQAAVIRASLAASSAIGVGVFVDASVDTILETAREYGLGFIQLHGPYTVADTKQLKAEGLGLIKVFAPNTPRFDWAILQDYADLVDYFLFDTAGPHPGGNGLAFDWNILQYYTLSTPFLLSGGIGPESLEALQNFQHPQWVGIDLNSKFETNPGHKDPKLLKTFIQAFKQIHV